MNRWSEANFLERLMSPSPQEKIDKKNPCPDADLLAAFSENRVDGFVLGAVAAHLIQCPQCAELHHRLLNLAKADPQANPAEWPNAEKRLENWMDAYLRAHPSPKESERHTAEVVSAAGAGAGSRWRSWKIRWALGSAAALALVVATIFLWSKTLPSRSRQPELATQTHPSTPPIPAGSPQESAQPAAENPSKIESAQAEEETPPKALHSSVKPKSHAAPARVPSADQDGASREKPAEPSSNALNSPAAPLETPQTQVAEQPSVLAEPSAAVSSTTPNTGNSSSGAVLASKTSKSANKGFVPVTKSAAHTPAGLPALISLEYSTSMWIQLNSDSPPEDGTFPFRGTLLKPVDLPTGVPFDTETRVDGLGAVNDDGRISLLIKGFFYRGARYKLKGGSGSARVEPFNGGKTLEIWLDEDSVYERVPGGPPPPDR